MVDRALAEVPGALRQVGLLDELEVAAVAGVVAELELVIGPSEDSSLAFSPSVRKNVWGSGSRTEVVVP